MYFGTVEKPPRLAEFKMEIPDARIAQKPPKNRDLCKLMVLDRKDESIHHMKFKDISDFFKKGDVLVKNHTKVFSARLFAKKDKYLLDTSSNLITYESDMNFSKLPNVFGEGAENNFLYFLNQLKINNFPVNKIKNFYYFQIGRWDLQLSDNKIINV